MAFLRPMTVLICATLAMATPPAWAQSGFGIGFGLGAAPFGENFENIRIGAVARGKLNEYLVAAFNEHCKTPQKQKEKPAECQEQRPFYKSAFLPVRGTPLPADIREKIGFVAPGTDYRQVGYSIYLIRLPDRRIHDVVSIWSDGWK